MLLSMALTTACAPAPTSPNVTLGPDAPTTVDPLTANAVIPGEREATVSYAWSRNGVLVEGLTGAEVPATETAKGETWTVMVTATENDRESQPSAASITIQNTPPTIDSATLSQASLQEEDTVTCEPSGAADADEDPVAMKTTWLVNGNSVSTADALSGVDFNKGDAVKCTLTPFDGEVDGAPAASGVVVVDNTAPRLDTVLLSPTDPQKGDTLVASLIGTSDPDDDILSFRYVWRVNGEIVSEEPTLSTDDLERDDSIQLEVTPFDGTTEGPPAISPAVAVDNTAPMLIELSVNPVKPTTETTITATPVTYDADGDDVTVSYTWAVDGVVIAAETGPTLDSSYFSRGQIVTVTAVPNDGARDGRALEAQGREVVNTPPRLAAVSVDPTELFEGTTATCVPSGWDDPDGDPETFTYAWAVNGAVVPGATTTTLTGAQFDKNDSVACTATPSDGRESGIAVSSGAYVVRNTAPTLASASLTPTAPTETDTVSVVLGSTADADGDSVTMQYSWTVNGVEVATTETLDGSLFDKGDTIAVAVTPTDGTTAGTAVSSSSITAINTAPEVTTVALSPSVPRSADAISAAITSKDVDGDALTFRYVWTINGTVDTRYTGSTLPASAVDRDDTIAVQVTPNDGDVDGSAVSSSTVTVKNTPPTITSAALSPSAIYEASTVTCIPSGWSDTDGDAEGYTYAWAVNGVAISGASTATLDGASFGRNDALTCTVTPNDGSDAGLPVTSGTSIVRNTAPTLASASLTPTAPAAGDTIAVVLGEAADVDGDTVLMKYSWSVNGTTGVSTKAALDSAFFSKGDRISVTVTPTDGTDDGSAVTSPAVVAVNTAPVISAVTVTPRSPRTTQDLVSAISATDADGDAITYSYTWTVDGVAMGTGTTLPASAFEKHERIELTVVPNDGDTDGSAVSSSIITAVNTAPVAPVLAVSPAEPDPGDALTCAVSKAATDADGDPLTYGTFTWTVDGTAYSASTTTTYTGDTIPAGVTQRGETWSCTTTVEDDDAASATATSKTKVQPWIALTGENAGDQAGYAVSSAGDVDGDGIDDIIVSAPNFDDAGSNAGRAYIFLGKSFGRISTIDIGDADYILTAEARGDLVGHSVASAGDVDGDGKGDLLISAHSNDDGGTRSGKIYLVLGKSLGSTIKINLADADYAFIGENSADLAGWAVAGAGDVDGDGDDDVMMSAIWNDDGGTNAGKTYIVLAKSLGTTTRIDLADADYTFTGEAADDESGRSLAPAGDVDGDGKDDILIGAYYNDDGGSDAGKVYLFLGKSLGSTADLDVTDADYTFTGESAGDQAARSIATAGDVDDDGKDDLLIGAMFNDDAGSSAGKAYLFLGKSLGSTADLDVSDADYTFEGEGTGDRFGAAVASAGDVDDDGMADLLFGAPSNDDGASNAGKAYLILGKNLGTSSSFDVSTADFTFEGEFAGAGAGRALATAGDVDDDGMSDLLVGARFSSETGVDAGAAYVIFGDALGL